MKKKVGGWTRILIVISGVLFVVGAIDMKAARDRGAKEAQDAYESEIAPLPKECTDESLAQGLRKFICPAPVPEPEARAERDSKIAETNRKALNAFFAFWLYPTAIMGAALWAIGWIRKGFRSPDKL